MSENYQLSSYSPGLSGYAPADFQDASETQPPEIILDPTSMGSTTPYSFLVNNISNRQLQEVRDKTVTGLSPGTAWKKRIRDFMLQKNDDLLQFVRKPLSSHPTLSQAEAFLKRFGMSNFTPTHHSLRDAFLDISGTSMTSSIEEELEAIGPASSVKLTEEVRWLYDQYRATGENLLKYEGILKMKVENFDKMQQKALGFVNLPQNEHSSALQDAAIAYLDTFFKEQGIETEYKNYIEAYRRFIALREMITTFRFVDNVDKEPLCSICLNDPVMFCLNPCGHTYCSSCVKRQMTNCYMCRAQIKDRVRIYFG